MPGPDLEVPPVGESTKQTIVAKITGIAVAGAAAWVAQKVLSKAWSAVTGHEPPDPEDDSEARIGEIAAAAVISGALVALARVLAQRGAAKYVK